MKKLEIKKTRERNIMIRVNDAEFARLAAGKEAAGARSLSDYLRQAGLEKASILGVR